MKKARHAQPSRLRLPSGTIPEMRTRLCGLLGHLGSLSEQLTVIEQIVRNPDTCVATDNTAISIALGTCCGDAVELAVEADALAEALNELETLCA
ncbi:hypothetical protein [Geminisphaera colitermitum]|uniref:hypothetical protein n=1 Tax=Geminisphaera colitermitum TaxID=1148786 RepID=UPI000158C71B|nr:hypothetical protein [Geminisphaera colitermitum]